MSDMTCRETYLWVKDDAAVGSMVQPLRSQVKRRLALCRISSARHPPLSKLRLTDEDLLASPLSTICCPRWLRNGCSFIGPAVATCVTHAAQ